jgi:hypothetical protein
MGGSTGWIRATCTAPTVSVRGTVAVVSVVKAVDVEGRAAGERRHELVQHTPDPAHAPAPAPSSSGVLLTSTSSSTSSAYSASSSSTYVSYFTFSSSFSSSSSSAAASSSSAITPPLHRGTRLPSASCGNVAVILTALVAVILTALVAVILTALTPRIPPRPPTNSRHPPGPPGGPARTARTVALQVAFERQTLKPVFSLDRL